MANKVRLVPPLGLLTSTPAWESPPTPDDRPINQEVRAYLTECFFLLPPRVAHCPEHQCIISEQGWMFIPDSFAEYPVLAIYFAKFRLRKYPFEEFRNDINWPEPYVVLNTIMKRLRSHRFLKGNVDAATIPEDIRKAITPDIVIPNGFENVVLEMPFSARKVSNERVIKV